MDRSVPGGEGISNSRSAAYLRCDVDDPASLLRQRPFRREYLQRRRALAQASWATAGSRWLVGHVRSSATLPVGLGSVVNGILGPALGHRPDFPVPAVIIWAH